MGHGPENRLVIRICWHKYQKTRPTRGRLILKPINHTIAQFIGQEVVRFGLIDLSRLSDQVRFGFLPGIQINPIFNIDIAIFQKINIDIDIAARWKPNIDIDIGNLLSNILICIPGTSWFETWYKQTFLRSLVSPTTPYELNFDWIQTQIYYWDWCCRTVQIAWSVYKKFWQEEKFKYWNVQRG